MLNNSIRLTPNRLRSAGIFDLGDDVAASVRDNFRANLARILAEKRESDGLTQEGFAKAVGVSPQKVSQWKSGVFPRPEQIDEIAKALGVSSEELFREAIEVPARDLHAAVKQLAASLGFDLKPRN